MSGSLKPMAMRRARSYEDFAADPTSKFRALDLVWRDRAFLDQTAFKDEPPVEHENCAALFEIMHFVITFPSETLWW
ncbi:hypothetical protein vseg_010947 [Gypsophila vaccaria]